MEAVKRATTRGTTESGSSHVCYTKNHRDWEPTWFLKEKHVGWELVMSAYSRIKETVSYHACYPVDFFYQKGRKG
jgi:hypothetical protein